MTDDRDEIEARVWQAWKDAEPPSGFADRVMEARAAAAAPRRSSLRRRLALVGLVAAAAVIAVMALGGSPTPRVEGRRSVAARESIPLGKRAVAVAEAGSELRWTIDRGGAVVTQERGDVFYRVESGGAFVVDTPLGRVRVTGTCFRVALEDPMGMTMTKMKPAIGGAAVGAALAATLVVTVYEGRVKVEKAQGQTIDVAAGESTRVGPSAGEAVPAPAPLPAADLAEPPSEASREDLLARDRRHRDQIAALQVRLGRAEADLSAAKGGGPHGGPRLHAGPDEDRLMFDPTQEDLLAMAKRCELAFALPPFGGDVERIRRQLAHAGLTPDEVRRAMEVMQPLGDRFAAEVRALYVEATGDTAGAETLELHTMAVEIMRKSADPDAVRQKIAEERAGLRPPPADPRSGTPLERYFRLALAAAPEFERALGAVVGAERVREHRDDFFGQRMVMNGCPGQDE